MRCEATPRGGPRAHNITHTNHTYPSTHQEPKSHAKKCPSGLPTYHLHLRTHSLVSSRYRWVKCGCLHHRQSKTGQNAVSAPDPAPVTNIGDRGDTIKTYLPELQEASRVSGFPISLLAATIQQESGWNPNAVSEAGAIGLSQFIPDTWASFGNGEEPTDPRAAIKAMGRYMAYLKTTLRNAGVEGNEVNNVLRAYNAGPGAVISQTGGYNDPENINYAPAIRNYWPQYQTLIKDLGIDDYPTGAEQPSLSNAAANNATPESTGSASASASTGKNDKKASSKGKCKDNKNQKSSNAENQKSGNTDKSGDDYPWKHLPHCSDDYTYCPEVTDPTNAFPGECVAFAAWRVVQQTGGNADNITFHSPATPPSGEGTGLPRAGKLEINPSLAPSSITTLASAEPAHMDTLP